MLSRRPSVNRSVRMTSICAASLLAAAGAGDSSAQPVARHLIDDADAIEVLHTEQSIATATRWASMHRLGDLDADGVDEILLTHVAQWPSPNPLADFFRASVISPRSDTVLFVLPPDESEGLRLSHTAAVMIDDIDGDGVRDLAAARLLASGIGLRVHSGATGELLRAPFIEDFRFAWGLSLLPWDDIDGDGQPDLIASNIGNNQGAYAFVTWSPGADTAAFFIPENYPPNGGSFQSGRAMLDLGVGATGSREFFSTLGAGLQSMVQAFGGDPLGFEASYISGTSNSLDGLVDGGAVRLGDLNGDGLREIVVTGRLPHPDIPGVLGIPVISGSLPMDFGQQLDLLTMHTPRIVADINGTPTTIEPVANHTVLPLGDATGDAFPDYAFVGSAERYLSPGEYELSDCIVAVCGRTGQAFFAAEVRYGEDAAVQVRINRLPNTPARARDSAVSPGDLNDDGAPDVLVLVVRTDTGDGSEDPIREQLLLTHYLPTPCAGDVDFDRVVNFADLNAVLSSFGAQDITLPADLNASGVVDFSDLNLVLSAFGVTCD